MLRIPSVFNRVFTFIVIVVAISFGYPQMLASPAVESVGRPALPIASAQGAGRPTPAPGQILQRSFSGEVVYWVHAGRAGRIFGEIGGTTTSTLLVPMPAVMNTTFRVQTPVSVELKLCIELAITVTNRSAGIQAFMDGAFMQPTVGGSSFLTGYVVGPRLGARFPIANFSQLESWCFDWESAAGPGFHTISYRWAVQPGTPAALVWGDYFAVSVWATKVKP